MTDDNDPTQSVLDEFELVCDCVKMTHEDACYNRDSETLQSLIDAHEDLTRLLGYRIARLRLLIDAEEADD